MMLAKDAWLAKKFALFPLEVECTLLPYMPFSNQGAAQTLTSSVTPIPGFLGQAKSNPTVVIYRNLSKNACRRLTCVWFVVDFV